jgi:hypothetical protein
LHRYRLSFVSLLMCCVCAALQDIPSIIAAAEAERSARLQLQAKMRDSQGADKGVVLYLQVRGLWWLLSG